MSAYSAALEAYVDGFVTDITATDATIDWIRPRAWIAGHASSAAEAEVAVDLIRSPIRERAPKLWRTKHRDAVIKGLQRMLAALRGPSLLAAESRCDPAADACACVHGLSQLARASLDATSCSFAQRW